MSVSYSRPITLLQTNSRFAIIANKIDLSVYRLDSFNLTVGVANCAFCLIRHIRVTTNESHALLFFSMLFKLKCSTVLLCCNFVFFNFCNYNNIFFLLRNFDNVESRRNIYIYIFEFRNNIFLEQVTTTKKNCLICLRNNRASSLVK